MKFFKIVYFALLIIYPITSFSQPFHDTIQLKAIEITAKKNQYIGILNKKAPFVLSANTDVGKSLADILDNYTNLVVRNSSPGNLATISIRGNSSAQTEVKWNGFNVNSSTTGQFDFSQIPAFFIEEISNSSPGSTRSLNIINHLPSNTSLKISLIQEIGSFNYINTAACFFGSSKNVSFQLKLIKTSADNNYKFLNFSKNLNNPPKEVRKEAAFLKNGFLLETSIRTRKNQKLESKIFFTSGKNDVPQPVHIPVFEDNENQSENHLKAMIHYSIDLQTLKMNFISGFFRDDLNYCNKLLGLNSLIIGDLINNRIEIEKTITDKLSVHGMTEYSSSTVTTNNYLTTRKRQTIEYYTGIKYESIKLLINSGLKIVQLNNNKIFGLPSIEVYFKPLNSNAIELSITANKTYRQPAMNDLYWSPGGNPNLQNEMGFSTDVGLAIFPIKGKKHEMSLSIKKYVTSTNHLIVWQPDTLSGIWKPFNQDKLKTGGIEIALEANSRLRNHTFSLKSSISTLDASVKKALPDGSFRVVYPAYTPDIVFHQIFSYSILNASITLNSKFTGKRYTDLSNSSSIPPFWKHDIAINYSFNMGMVKSTASLSFENITNTHYEYFVWYPMPGFNFRAGLKFEIIQVKHY